MTKSTKLKIETTTEETLLEVVQSLRDMMKKTYDKQFELLQCEIFKFHEKIDKISIKLDNSEKENITIKKENLTIGSEY